MVELLPPQDATLWRVQTPDAPLHIGALCLFEGGPLRDRSGALRLDALRQRAASQLSAVPRFRRVITALPLDQGLAWVDDEHFDPSHHVRAIAVPVPGGDAELRQLMVHLLEAPLDPRRPPWEVWLVDGLAGDRVALVLKASHVLADGMALLEMGLRLLDAEPGTEIDAPSTPWVASPRPSDAALLGAALVDRARRVVRGARDSLSLLADPRLVGASVGTLRRLADRARARPAAGPATRAVGPHRDYAWTRLPMSEVLAVKREAGVTVNDVVLTLVTGALARYGPQEGGDVAAARPPRVLVPVAARGVGTDEVQNRFSMVVASLPLHLEDPAERLRWLHDEMAHRKGSIQSSVAKALFPLVDLVPGWAVRRAGPVILQHQPVVDLVVTNLPGTADPGYLLGSRMLAAYPFITVTGNLSTIIGVLSYAGGLGVSATVDADVVHDADRLLAGLQPALDELVQAVGC